MRFDRVRAKWDARAGMAGASPHPMLVTLVYLLLTTGLTSGGSFVILLLASNSPLTALKGMALGADYYPAELWSGAWLLPYLFFTILMGLFSQVLAAGYTAYSLNMARGRRAGLQDLLDIFSMAGRVLLAVVWMSLCALGWTMLGMGALFLLCLPGALLGGPAMLLTVLGAVGFMIYVLWVSLRYALTFFFLVDEPEAGARAAVRNSVAYMRGWKWECFKLQISFLGWQILSALTAGIVGLWVTPYSMTTMANFYDFVTGRWPRGPQPGALDGTAPF